MGEAAYPWNGEYVYGVSQWSGARDSRVGSSDGSAEVRVGRSSGQGHRATLGAPIRDIGVALGANGNLYVWSRKYKEDWAAFDPSFKTLVDNKEYVEKEDEFDVKPNDFDGGLGSHNRYTIDVDNLPECLFKKVNYYTDESDDDVLHGLPLRIEPDPELEKVMAARRESGIGRLTKRKTQGGGRSGGERGKGNAGVRKAVVYT